VDSIRVEPREAQAHPGETVRLACSVPLAGYTLRWTKMGGEPLPVSASDRSGQLIINNVSPADSGVYVCTASDTQGRTQQFQARVTIVTQRFVSDIILHHLIKLLRLP
jgi:Immunoglobulin domain